MFLHMLDQYIHCATIELYDCNANNFWEFCYHETNNTNRSIEERFLYKKSFSRSLSASDCSKTKDLKNYRRSHHSTIIWVSAGVGQRELLRIGAYAYLDQYNGITRQTQAAGVQKSLLSLMVLTLIGCHCAASPLQGIHVEFCIAKQLEKGS